MFSWIINSGSFYKLWFC